MQVFESSDGVTALVETDLVTYRPGLIRSPAVVWEPIRLYRIEVGRDGTVSRIALKSPAGKSYLLYIEPVVKFRDDLYLLEPPHLGHLLPQLHRIRGDRLEPISAEEIGMRERYGPWGGLRSATAAVVRDLGNCKPTSEVRRLAR
jgi:hypothetical protein